MPNTLRIAAPLALLVLAACSAAESSLTDPSGASPDTATSPALGSRRVFPADTPLYAPLWVAERAVCSWLAVASRLTVGGVRYRGTVLRHAATPMRELRTRHAEARRRRSARREPPRRSA